MKPKMFIVSEHKVRINVIPIATKLHHAEQLGCDLEYEVYGLLSAYHKENMCDEFSVSRCETGDLATFCTDVCLRGNSVEHVYGAAIEICKYIENHPDLRLKDQELGIMSLTAEEITLAESEGWGIFDADGELQLQKIDDLNIFVKDEDAHEFVKAKASTGSTLHIKAREILQAHSPIEFNRVFS